MGAGRILVVDDNPDILEVLRIILESEGYSVKLLLRGEDTMHSINSFHPALIILDVMLGSTDGRDICNTIKHTGSSLHIPVIMISATHNLEQALDHQCFPNDFLEKPFDIENLLATIKKNLAA